MDNYYKEKLGAQKLFQVYDTGIPRISQYLNAEIDFVKGSLTKSLDVLELGAGYGRIVKELAPYCNTIVGVDISPDSVSLGKEYVKGHENASLMTADVHNMEFENTFDVILCMQNGLSSMGVNATLVGKLLEMLSPNGMAFFSTYSDKIWDYRVKWFEEQAEKGYVHAAGKSSLNLIFSPNPIFLFGCSHYL